MKLVTLQAYVLSWFRIFKWEPYEPTRVRLYVCLSRTYPALPLASLPIQSRNFQVHHE